MVQMVTIDQCPILTLAHRSESMRETFVVIARSPLLCLVGRTVHKINTNGAFFAPLQGR